MIANTLTSPFILFFVLGMPSGYVRTELLGMPIAAVELAARLRLGSPITAHCSPSPMSKSFVEAVSNV